MNLCRVRLVAGAIALFLCAFIAGSTFGSWLQRDVRPPTVHQIDAMKSLAVAIATR
jgi:hypothetical protein